MYDTADRSERTRAVVSLIPFFLALQQSRMVVFQQMITSEKLKRLWYNDFRREKLRRIEERNLLGFLCRTVVTSVAHLPFFLVPSRR